MLFMCLCFFFFKQKTAYEMRISDWSSDVCSSDLLKAASGPFAAPVFGMAKGRKRRSMDRAHRPFMGQQYDQPLDLPPVAETDMVAQIPAAVGPRRDRKSVV